MSERAGGDGCLLRIFFSTLNHIRRSGTGPPQPLINHSCFNSVNGVPHRSTAPFVLQAIVTVVFSALPGRFEDALWAWG
jgi:hypothetical protein